MAPADDDRTVATFTHRRTRNVVRAGRLVECLAVMDG
jgi:hypothetical protein